MFEANLGLNDFYVVKLFKYSNLAEDSAFLFADGKRKVFFKNKAVLKRCWDGLIRTGSFEELKKKTWNFKVLSFCLILNSWLTSIQSLIELRGGSALVVVLELERSPACFETMSIISLWCKSWNNSKRPHHPVLSSELCKARP